MSTVSVQERAVQLRDILEAIKTEGVAEAVRRHGSGLTDAERALVLSLTPVEATRLLKVAESVGGGGIARDNNIF